MMLYMHRVQRAADVALKLEPTVVHDDVQSIMYVRLSDVEQLNRILILVTSGSVLTSDHVGLICVAFRLCAVNSSIMLKKHSIKAMCCSLLDLTCQ